MLQAIIFDLDDTLYDEKQFVRGGFDAVSHHVSIKYDVNQDIVHQLLFETLYEHGRGHTFDIALKKLGIYEKKDISRLVEIYRNHTPNLKLYPEATIVLSHLKKNDYKLGLITDGNVEVQKNKVKALRVEDFFDCMIFSDEYGIEKQKPNPFPYLKAIEKLKVKNTKSVYVGDNPHKDFITPNKLGLVTIRILKGNYENITLDDEFEAKYQIKNIIELLDLIPHIDKI